MLLTFRPLKKYLCSENIDGRIPRDILIGEMTLQTLLEKASVSFRPFFRSFDKRMEMSIIYRHHPDANACDLCADSHTVPAKHFVFHRVERNVRPCSVRVYMPDIINRLIHFFFPARYANLSVFAKRKRIKMKNGLVALCKAIIVRSNSTKKEGI